MSRTSKPQTASSKAAKPVPTQWRDRLAPEDYEELKQTFEVFDEDGSGTIDPPEINKVLEELGVDRRSPYVLRIINGLKEKSKPITFDEFVDIAAGQIGETKTKDGIKRVFKLFDQDDNGVIDFDEFKGVAKYLKDGINDDEILEMMHSTHVSQKTSTNEGFTFEEFYGIVSRFNNKWTPWSMIPFIKS